MGRTIELLSGASSRLLSVQSEGAIYAYEILNFVDGPEGYQLAFPRKCTFT